MKKVIVYDYKINGTPIAIYDADNGVIIEKAMSMPFYNTAGGLVHEASDWQDCNIPAEEFGDIQQEDDFLFLLDNE